MKNFLTILTVAALALPLHAQDAQMAPDAAPPPQQQPQEQAQAAAPDANNTVSFQSFYDQLSSYGTWINSDQYGYVFQPTENDSNWRPYTYGHWVNTDAGMTWASDEPFGWATYHYGRWTNIAGTGWVWVPGYTWSPAWVSWRQSDTDVGWAPLPPESNVGVDYYAAGYDPGYLDVGFHIGDDCDLAYGIGPWWYNFCPVAYIGDPYCWRHFRDRRDNFAFIGRTRNITNINFNRNGAGRFGRVHANGPSVAALNARSHTPIHQATLASVNDRNQAGLRGNTLNAFAPRVDPATARTAHPANVSRTLGNNVAVNRGTNIHDPVAMNSHLSPATASTEQVRAASTSASSFSSARVATANTHLSRSLSQPLTSMRTETRATNATATRNAMATPQAAESRLTGQPAERTAVAPATTGESRFTGEANASRTHAATAASNESRLTSQPATRTAMAPVTRHTTPTVSNEQQFTGQTTTRRTSPAVSSESGFTGGNVYHAQQPAFQTHTAPVMHNYSAPAASSYRAPSYSRSYSAPSYHTSSPSFHSSARTYSAPAAHYSAPARSFGGGGGVSHASAPAASAGGGGGGHHR